MFCLLSGWNTWGDPELARLTVLRTALRGHGKFSGYALIQGPKRPAAPGTVRPGLLTAVQLVRRSIAVRRNG